MRILLLSFFFLSTTMVFSQDKPFEDKFAQLGTDLPTPNSYRNASGAPGVDYWQQKADYKMKLEIDDDNQKLMGEETITYTNNSPDRLKYLWLQLDQNMRAKDSDTYKIRGSELNDRTNINRLGRLDRDFDGGFKIDYVKDANGKDLAHTINKTMMRIDLPQSLATGQKFEFKIKWWYNINNTNEMGGRSGYEPFEEDGNNVYCIAQFFPRMCAYNDIEGWQNKQFLGRGEFALVFGDYEVEITVPADHLVAATGDLINADKVLTSTQKKRYNEAKKSHEQTVMIATYEEAEERMKSKSTKKKTWKYSAKNVRDYAFSTSRRFIWDAMGVPMKDGRTVMAQSMYIKEGDCLWSQYSTKAVAHTVKWFSHYTVDYPYPVAWSIDGSMGMEYPMICFNFGRCEDDSTYTQRMKYGHIGVIIHEVGHNWFPMIINSDERQWTWMDEGLNSFTQFLVEQHWEKDFPSRYGYPDLITNYMGGDKANISPIMTNSESIKQFGRNAYQKPSVALNVLRETVMGRELFDFAFKEYCERWAFKQPYPADFFRTMEDASGTDLDWFWRGWFYSTDHVDISLNGVKAISATSFDAVKQKEEDAAKRDAGPKSITKIRNEKDIPETRADRDPSIIDFYSTYDPLKVDAIDREDQKKLMEGLSEKEKAMIASGKNFYELTFEMQGGLLTPIVFDFVFEDGTKETVRIPVEIWKGNKSKVTKVFPTDKKVKEIILDPYLETADVDRSNNYFPKREEENRFEMFKKKREQGPRENPMQRDRRAKKKGRA